MSSRIFHPDMSLSSRIFSSAPLVFSLAILLRCVLLLWGVYQDAHSPIKYTDIDYMVFTDASRYLSRGQSPYTRATYRYTPLLAWLLYPTTWGGPWFHFGKGLFALSDIVAGWILFVLLRARKLSKARSLKYASVWLLNPMVANISTRGSSEGLLCALVLLLLWAFTTNRISLAGILLGTAVHLKIYPFIYGPSLLWALPSTTPWTKNTALIHRAVDFCTNARLTLLTTSLATFTVLNGIMYAMYGRAFLQHTFIHHLTRLDHRHNFSPYNTLLYLSSVSSSFQQSNQSTITTTTTNLSQTFTQSLPRLAFLPQLSLSLALLPLLSRQNLPSTLLIQTLAFTTFNKVCTSQYFLWYLVFLPLHLPTSHLLHHRPRLSIAVLTAWVLAQALWLQQGYDLEFLGKGQAFMPGLWMASLLFFSVNCWILGLLIRDVEEETGIEPTVVGTMTEKDKKLLGQQRKTTQPQEKGDDSVSFNDEGEPGPAVATTPAKMSSLSSAAGARYRSTPGTAEQNEKISEKEQQKKSPEQRTVHTTNLTQKERRKSGF